LEFEAEINIKNELISRLENQIKALMKELTIAKHIIKDPNLSKKVCRAFNQNISKNEEKTLKE